MLRDILDTVSSWIGLIAWLCGPWLFKHSGIKIPANPATVDLKTIAHKPADSKDRPTDFCPAAIWPDGHTQGVVASVPIPVRAAPRPGCSAECGVCWLDTWPLMATAGAQASAFMLAVLCLMGYIDLIKAWI